MANRFTRAISALFSAVPPLEQPPSTPPLNDVTTYERALIGMGPRYNPDQLVGRKGLGIYQQMRLDEQVKAVMNFKRDAITARGWTFKYEDESKLSETERTQRIRVFTEIMCRMQGSFLDGLNLIAMGRDFGFSMTEKVYSDVTIDGQTYVGLSMLLGRDPSTFFFYTDDFGILQRVEQFTPSRRTNVDMSRVIHYIHSPEFDPFYGRSDLREAYRSWYVKDRLVTLWTNYLERMAGGIVEVRRTEESTAKYGTPEYASLQEVLTNVHGAMGIIMPIGTQLNVWTPPTTDAYEKALVFFDLAIAKALLVPNLLGISHTGQTGAYAQSQTQLEAFFWTLNADAQRLEATINEQLVKDLGDQNYGDGDYPEFCFKPASREHVLQLINSWAALTGAKAVIATQEDEDHFRKLLEMPPRSDSSTPLAQEIAASQPATAAGDATGKPIPSSDTTGKLGAANDIAYTRMTEEFAALKAVIAELGKKEPVKESHGHSRAVPHGKLKTATEAQFSRAVQRVAFTVIEDRQNRMAGELTGQVAGFTAKAVKKLLGTDEDLSKLIDTDTSDIPGVELSGFQKGKLKDLYRKSLASAWTLGGALARNELERARGQRFVAMTDLREKAGDFFEVNGFRMAGNVSDGIKAVIQQELQNSVKLGRTAKDTREVIWDRLVSRGFTNRESVLDTEDDPQVVHTLKDLWGASEKQTAAYLDTLSRTNLFEAMNEARFSEFTDPALGGFVQAMEYSAILDDRTTEICQALNGKVWAEDSDEWDAYRPPNHYNCRSVLIPVTEVDGWDGVEAPAPTVQPQAGFGGTLQ